MLRSSSPIGVPFPPEPYAHRRHTPQPHARWEAIRLNLNDSGAPSDLRREHPEPRGITVTGTAGDLHPDSPKRAGKPRIRASPHHHLGHRLIPSICYHAKGPRTQAKPKVKAMVCDRKGCGWSAEQNNPFPQPREIVNACRRDCCARSRGPASAPAPAHSRSP